MVALWTTRTTSSGRFEAAKKSGDVLYGSRREDVAHLEDHPAVVALIRFIGWLSSAPSRRADRLARRPR